MGRLRYGWFGFAAIATLGLVAGPVLGAATSLRIVSVVPQPNGGADVVVVAPPPRTEGSPPAFRVTAAGRVLPSSARAVVDGYFEVAIALDAGSHATPADVAALRAAAVEFVLRLPPGTHVRVLDASGEPAGVPSPVAGVMAAGTDRPPPAAAVDAFVGSIDAMPGAHGALVSFVRGTATDDEVTANAATAARAPIDVYTMQLAARGTNAIYNGGAARSYASAARLRAAAASLARSFAHTWVLHVTRTGVAGELEVAARDGAVVATGTAPVAGVLAAEVGTTPPRPASRRGPSLLLLVAVAVAALGAAAIAGAAGSRSSAEIDGAPPSGLARHVAEDVPWAAAILTIAFVVLLVLRLTA